MILIRALSFSKAHLLRNEHRGIPRIELETSRTLSENHTTRPNALSKKNATFLTPTQYIFFSQV